MPAITKLYANIEFADERTAAVRILLADKLKYETTARKHDWNAEPQTISEHVFLAWAAAKRKGLTEASYDDFKNSEVIDVLLTNEAPEDDTEADPTPESGRH